MNEHYPVRVYESELALIADETRGHVDLETGGNLFGLFSHGGGPTVFLATRPAGRFRKTPTALELDPGITRELEELAWKRYGVQCIGMWHSHHWIGLLEPSNGDRERTRRYAQKYDRPQYTEILANFVGERPSRAGEDAAVVQLTPFFYLDARNLSRAESTIEVLPGMSPLRRELTEHQHDSALSGALRPPVRLPNGCYRLAGSAGTGASARGIRRLFGGAATGRTGPEFYQEVADDQRGLDEPGKTLEPERDSRAEETSARAIEPPGPAPQPPAPEGAWVQSAHLRPIPDLTDFVTRYLEPVLQRLAGQYEVQLDIIDADRLAVLIHRPRHHAQALLLVGWDGTAAVAFGCEVVVASQVERLPPDRGVSGLDGPLQWSLSRLARLP
ncbi:hypothetical protein [Nocardia sp. N2S4-5]|uniref:hypothetical protein n=1 Tax=Nocardia sp. N2S4-5 TaxID=3351565 RepID=UPI0037D2068B